MAVTETEIATGKRWLDVINPGKDDLEKIAADFDLPEPLVLDCLDPDHIPKVEKNGSYTFIILRLFDTNPRIRAHTMQDLTAKIAIFYSDNYLITLHTGELAFMQDCLLNDEENTCPTAHLVTQILWRVLETYRHPAIALGEQIDEYEDTVLLKHTRPTLMQGLYFIKRKASICKKMLLLTDDVISFLRANDNHKDAMRDVIDHHKELTILFDQVLDDVTNLLSIYLSLSSQKTGEVMKTLTIFSVFFMPLTFIVGIYGMNFHHMPELSSRWGYPAVLAVMGITCIIIFMWVKHKRWL